MNNKVLYYLSFEFNEKDKEKIIQKSQILFEEKDLVFTKINGRKKVVLF